MAAPLKPWERAGVNQRNDMSSVMQNDSRPSVGHTSVDFTGGALPAPASGVPPSLPPRPTQQSAYSSGYNSMGYGGYGGYSSYGGYGGLGSISPMYGGGYGGYGYGGYGGINSGINSGLNRYGQTGYNSSGFVQTAEESSRQAFQSIESIVQAFGSVSMMLESTYSAVFNSFRAVLGVADHFSRMRTQFAQIFSAFAVVKTLRWLYRRLLVLLRLRASGLEEDAWAAATSQTADALLGAAAGANGNARSSWPIMLFFAVIIGGPWLIWKFLSSLPSGQGSGWVNGDADHFVGVAQFDFQGDSDEELTFRRGQRINIAPKEQQPRVRGWLLASVDGQKTGLIPANYIKILGKRKGRKNVVVSQPVQQPSANQGFEASFFKPPNPNQNSQIVNQPQQQVSAFSEAMNSVFISDSPQPADDLYENAMQQSLAPETSLAQVTDQEMKEASEILEDSSNSSTSNVQ